MHVAVYLIPEEDSKLDALAESAAACEGAELEKIEAEINRIVYRLFDLTDEEIALIDSNLATVG